ncbi:hypothetical protein IMCC3317_41910 [Kordia antarctica]|uniref:Uncharacterized protein n=1 Tax=Kordia antarctica TaxID=1218801 RepID=A0A7L4ZQJ1_9FLAO|nr:hypothetical protein [Kordia antarctica]QHI38791.1 hypothetical protein IMCC3317_41910 [Kordia antarctica]
MKKRNLKSLQLNKKSISNINETVKGGIYRTAGCYSVQICHIEPDTDHTLKPIPVDSWGSCHPCQTIIC